MLAIGLIIILPAVDQPLVLVSAILYLGALVQARYKHARFIIIMTLKLT